MENLMKKPEKYARLCRMTGLFVLFMIFTQCERNEYDLLDPSTAGKWTLYTTTAGIPGNSIGDVKQDSKNNIWVACPGSGVAFYSSGKWTPYTTSNSQILSNYVTSVAETSTGTILFGTTNGVSIRSSTGQWSYFRDPSAIMNVTTIKVTSKGEVWAGTEGRTVYYNTGAGWINIYDSYVTNVYAIEEDASGNIYLGTDYGILKKSGTTWTQISTSNGLPSNLVTALYLDSKKRLWIGTYGGKTVCYMDSSGKLTQINLMGGDPGTLINDIFEDRNGDMWFATYLGGVIHYDWIVPVSFKQSTGFYEDKVTSIGGDKDGNLWFGLYSKGVAEFSLPLN
jgi:ligand-binding sensor domain-containing protein